MSFNRVINMEMKNASPAGLCCGRRLPSYFIKTHKLSEELTNYPEALRLYFIYTMFLVFGS